MPDTLKDDPNKIDDGYESITHEDIQKINTNDLHKLEIMNHLEKEREVSRQELELKQKEHKLELELKKKEFNNSLVSCCYTLHKPSAVFFTQVSTIATVIIGSGVGLAMTSNPILIPVFSGLISFSIGLLFPQPKIKDD